MLIKKLRIITCASIGGGCLELENEILVPHHLSKNCVSHMEKFEAQNVYFEMGMKEFAYINSHQLGTHHNLDFKHSFFLWIHRFPAQLRSVCHCLYQVVAQRFPQNAFGAVGSAIFLRFINPAIGK